MILQSLDAVNRYLEEDYPIALATCCEQVAALKRVLCAAGHTLVGDEPLKVTLATKGYGYTGEQLAAYLKEQGIVCEFADPHRLVLMFTPDNAEEDFTQIKAALTCLEKREPLTDTAPTLATPKVALSLRQALFAPAEVLPLEQCLGRVLASPTVSCPPAVPILVGGEVVDESAVKLFRYYGYDTLRVIKE